MFDSMGKRTSHTAGYKQVIAGLIVYLNHQRIHVITGTDLFNWELKGRRYMGMIRNSNITQLTQLRPSSCDVTN
jgi:hypothetical protein